MNRLTGYEKVALVLTALFLAVCAGIFCLGRSGQAYTVTVSDRSPETVLQGEDVSADGTPDSLLPGEKINVNTAPPLDLARLPGIGETKAQAIADYREKNGPFRTEQELLFVEGIGEGTLEKIAPYIEIG